MANNKRPRQQAEGAVKYSLDSNDMARILMLFSAHHGGAVTLPDMAGVAPAERVFECKTCSRQFPSFQALGGHRASHKKPRLEDAGGGVDGEPAKPKVHECSICGLEFAIGQALGGHMRRHRAVMADSLGLGLSLRPNVGGLKDDGKKTVTVAPATPRALDLNAPAIEEELERTKLELTVEFPMVVDFPR